MRNTLEVYVRISPLNALRVGHISRIHAARSGEPTYWNCSLISEVGEMLAFDTALGFGRARTRMSEMVKKFFGVQAVFSKDVLEAEQELLTES